MTLGSLGKSSCIAVGFVIGMAFAPAHAVDDSMGNAKQNGFGPSTLALLNFCGSGQVCDVADVTGDRFADLVAVDPYARRVLIASNTRAVPVGFLTMAQPFEALGPGQTYAWGDANGDRRADLFVCDQRTGIASWFEALASGTLSTLRRPVTGGFCRAGEQFRVGDVNGDGLADALRFHMSSTPPAGQVQVALNTGGRFSPPTVWHDFFGIADEQVRVADLTGDGRADILTCVPGNGAYIGEAGADGHFRVRRPRVGIGDSAGLPQLLDLALPGETCLTGNFDGGLRHDMVVFAHEVIAPASGDEFHDRRGDVFVALSHGWLDTADGYRVTRPRLRHEKFCLAGEQCAVGDLNGDGKDDLVSFSRGVGGSYHVTVAMNRFGAPATWAFDMRRIRARSTEGTGDKPLILALNFRSTFGRVGSTVISRNAYNEDFAAGIVAGGPSIAIPLAVGRSSFSGVRLRTLDDLMRGQRLEVFGSLVVVIEKDLSASAAYSGLLDEATRALTTVLQSKVERRSVISVMLGDGLLSGGLSTLENELKAHMFSAIDDLAHLVLSAPWDPDDLVGVHLALFPALDKELLGALAPTGDSSLSIEIPGQGYFGVLPRFMPFRSGPMWYEIDTLFR